jgi:hypothetical protein
MRENILLEVSRIHDLMGVKSSQIISEKSVGGLLNEAKFPGFDMPKIKTDWPKIEIKLKNLNLDIPNLKNLDAASKLDILKPGAALKHLETFRSLWVTKLMDSAKLSKEMAELNIDTSINVLKKIEEAAPDKPPRIGDLGSDGTPKWTGLPTQDGIRSAILYRYSQKFPTAFEKIRQQADKLKIKNITDIPDEVKVKVDDAKVKVDDAKVKPKNLPKSSADAKKLGYDETKMFNEYKTKYPKGTTAKMYQDIANGKWSPSSKTKIKSTPVVKNKKTLADTILTTTNPKTGKFYTKRDIKKIQEEFGVTPYNKNEPINSPNNIQNANDNVQLKNALDSGWKPGDPIPDEFKLDSVKYGDIPEENLNTSLDSPQNVGGIYEKIASVRDANNKPVYEPQRTLEVFGANQKNPEHMEKLNKAWDAGWRPDVGPPTGKYDRYRIKDTDEFCRNLVDSDDIEYDFDDVFNNVFMGNKKQPKDYEKFADLWETGWRPGQPIELKFQTVRFKNKLDLPEGKAFDVAKDFVNQPSGLKSFLKFIWSRPFGFWEDVIKGKNFKSTNEATQKLRFEFEQKVKAAVNNAITNKKNNIEFLREELLKLRRDPTLKTAMGEDCEKFLEDISNSLKKELNQSSLDPTIKAEATKKIDLVISQMKEDPTGSVREIMEMARERFGSGDKWYEIQGYKDSMAQFFTQPDMYGLGWWSVRDIKGAEGVKGKIGASLNNFFRWVIGRGINLIRSGTFWSNKEILAIRTASDFGRWPAIGQFIGRQIFMRIILPGVWGATVMKTYYNLGAEVEDIDSIGNTNNWDATIWDTTAKAIWDYNFSGLKSLKEFNFSQDKWDLIWTGIKFFTPGDMDRGVEWLVRETKDENNDFYKIYYINKTIGRPIPYPAGEGGNKDDVQKKIDDLIKADSSVQICDVSKLEKNKEEILIIPANNFYYCDVKTGKPNDKNYFIITYSGTNLFCQSVLQGLIPPNTNKEIIFDKETACNTSIRLGNYPHSCVDGKCVANLKKGEYDSYTECVAKCNVINPIKDKINGEVQPGRTKEYAGYLYKLTTGEELGTGKDWADKIYEGSDDIKNGWTAIYVADETNYIFISIKEDNTGEYVEVPKTELNNKTKEEKYSYVKGLQWKPLKTVKTESIMKTLRKYIMLEQRMKFGLDNFKHWNDTFKFQAEDEKNPGQFKDVKINMEDVMDRIDHFRKKYDEDDAFVRAVIDTHENVIRIMFTKDLADIHESARPIGLAYVLSVIKEGRGEMEIWTVSRPASGNWFLVKGDFNKKQLANMELKKVEPKDKEEKKKEKPEEGLKKKEEEALILLKNNEKDGLNHLPKRVREKVKEKLRKGWVIEPPYEFFNEFYTKSEINTVFNDKIEIFKLKPTKEFFNSLVKNSSKLFLRRGFCKSLDYVKNDTSIEGRSSEIMKHLLNKCNSKFEDNYGIAQI